MPRPLTRRQHLENAAFLKALRRTGNIRLAARELGLMPSTLHGRRTSHPAFAQEWDAAIAAAHADFTARGGRAGPVAAQRAPADPAPGDDRGHRTRGGETVVVRRADGKLQVRAAQPGKLTRQCEQAFLAALSATANVRLAAAAAGAAVAAFYRRRRTNPAFAREMRMALETGYERVEAAVIAAGLPDSARDDAWRHNTPPLMPPLRFDEALHLLHLHQKEVRLQSDPPHIKRRRGESREAHSYRLAALYEAAQQRLRDDYAVAEAARREGAARSPHEPSAPVLPDLAQVRWKRRGG